SCKTQVSPSKTKPPSLTPRPAPRPIPKFSFSSSATASAETFLLVAKSGKRGRIPGGGGAAVSFPRHAIPHRPRPRSSNAENPHPWIPDPGGTPPPPPRPAHSE